MTAQHVTREQVLAFRLDGHNLSRRRPAADLIEVAAACGIRNTPPGSAILAAHARLAGLAPDALDRALENRALVEALSVRISPLIVPVRDVAVFTLGALPADEAALRSVVEALAPALDRAGMPAAEALRLTTEAAWAVLDGRLLTRGALSAAVTTRLPEALSPFCRPCNSRHVQESLFRLAGVNGAFVIAARTGKDALYARPDQWLSAAPGAESDQRERSAPPAGATQRPAGGAERADAVPHSGMPASPASARAELLRHYLRCYGPSTPAHFATWVGTRSADAQRTWDALAGELAEVNLAGRRTWLLAADLPRLTGSPAPTSVRLLPPYDAYLDQRDRETLVPDKSRHRAVWKILGNPGAVLADGEIAGLWRPQKKGKRLIVTVDLFEPVPPQLRDEIAAEAETLGAYRGAASVEVVVEGS